MRIFSFIGFFFISLLTFSQTPSLINYQGVARDVYGVPLVNQTITITFKIFDHISAGSQEYIETQPGISTGSLGIFYTQFGNQNSPTKLSGIPWDAGSHFLEVTISGTFGSATLPRNQLVTVPYAFYAEKAGSAPSPSVDFSNNILTIGTFSANIASPTYSLNFASPNSGTLTNGLSSTPVSIPQPTITGISNIGISGSWPAIGITALYTGSTAVWSTLGNTGTNPPSNFIGTTDANNLVFKTNNNQHAVITTSGNVGIGVTTPASKLDVSGSTPSALNVLNTSNGNAITAISNGGTPGIFVTNSGAGYALEAQNSSNGGSVHGIKGAGATYGSAGVFENTSTANTSPALFVSTNSTANGNGIDVTAATGNAISANNSSSVAPTIVATNSGAGNAINATASGNGNGIRTDANGIGLSLLAVKQSTSSTGTVAKIDNQNPSNGAVTLDVNNSSTISGAVALNITSSSSSTNSAIGLQIHNGHIKSLGASPSTGTITQSGFSTALTGTGLSFLNATDIKGQVTISFSNPTATALTGAFIEAQIIFNKPYSAGFPPTVVVTSLSDLFGFDYRVGTVSNTGFTIRVYRTSNSAITFPNSFPSGAVSFIFNYIVIE